MRKIINYRLLFSSLLLKSRKCVKGSISLFLALIVTPLLGMTLLMVESIRYQDAIEEMIEISDLCSWATLANYDPFLKERFGLLAVSQDQKIQDFYEKYFSENRKLIANDTLIESIKVNGKYTFEDIDVLEQQLLEYSEFSSVFESAFEGLDISTILKNLNEICNAKKFNTFGSELTSSAKICQAIADASTTVEEAIVFIEEEYKPALKTYNDAYEEFEEKLNDYIEVLNEYDEDDEDIYDEDDVEKAWKALASGNDCPKRTYTKACDDLADKINDLNKKISKVTKSLGDAVKEYESLRDELNSEEDKVTGFDFALSVADTILPMLQTIEDRGFDKYAEKTSKALKDMAKKLRKLKDTDFDYDSSTDDTKGDFYVDIPENIVDVVTALLDYDDLLKGIDVGEEFEDAKDMINFFTSLLDIPGMIDGNLYASIKYEKNEQQMSFSIFADDVEAGFKQNNDLANAVGIVAIAQLTDCVRTCTFPVNPIEALLFNVEIAIATTALATALALWITNTLVNTVLFAVDAFTKTQELWNHYLLAGYAAYNFPNRTNYMKKVDLTGYDYGKKMYKEVCGRSLTNPGFFDYVEASNSINAFQMIINACTGKGFIPEEKDITFYGAESEYLLVGWKNEVFNQCGAFYNILMLRMVLNLAPLFKDREVAKEAKNAGAYAWIIYILVFLGDSLLDTFILANGGDVVFVKQKMYLTATGVKDLWNDLSKTSDLAKKIKNMTDKYEKFKGFDTKTDKTDLGKWWSPRADYSFHMFILFLLCCHYDPLLERVQNVVRNESEAYYLHHKGNSDYFSITRTYTYVYSDISYKINPMFDYASLTDNPIVSETIRQERYIGY